MDAAGKENTYPIDFCTLGMFIIDEIHFPQPKASVYNILGGAGSYSALGARIHSPPPSSTSVGWIVDCGSDFPSELRETISSWETDCLFRETPERLTTRGWNEYGEHEHRAFRYSTPKLRLDSDSLTLKLLASKSFHLICSPARCINLIERTLARRKHELNLDPTRQGPLFIWEPVPDLCTPEELQQCYEALKMVHIVSPNHQELAGFLGKSADVVLEGRLRHEVVETMCRVWLESGIGPDRNGSVVIRCGANGSYHANLNSSKTLKGEWLPAYHHDSTKVVDPTGGGNTFLGGFAVGLVRTGNVREATIWGNIAASLAIEQVGIPTLQKNEKSSEMWNGVRIADRMIEYKTRLEGYEQPKGGQTS